MKVLESEKIQELNIYHFATVFNARMAAQYFFLQSPFLSLAFKYIRLNDPLLYNCLFHHQFLFNLPFHSNKGTQEKCDHCRKKINIQFTSPGHLSEKTACVKNKISLQVTHWKCMKYRKEKIGFCQLTSTSSYHATQHLAFLFRTNKCIHLRWHNYM